MKIAIIADLHLNKSTYKQFMDRDEFPTLPFRNADFMRSFRWIIDQCVKQIKPNFIVINGDIYDTYDPNNEVRGFFSEQLSRCVEAKIPVLMLLGNHDVCMRHHALTDIEKLKLKNIRVVSSSRIIDFAGQDNKSNIRLLLFPYSLDIERKIVSIKDSFREFKNEVEKKEPSKGPVLFFGHFPVLNAVLNTYNQEEQDGISEITNTTTTESMMTEKQYYNRNKNDISAEDLDSIGANYVFLGDLHNYQILNTKKCIAMYSGSIEKNSFNEVNQKKGFVLYDDSLENEGNMGCCRFIEYPYCRPMLDLRGNLDVMRKQFNKIDPSEYKNTIVRLNFEGTSSESAEFSANIEKFKKDILDKTKAIHIYSNAPVVVDPEVAAAISKIEKEIQERGHMEAADIIEVVKEIISEKVTDDKEKKETIDLAIQIYQETMKVRK